MLQSMREGVGKWIVWVIIILIIITLGFWGISSYFFDGGASTPPVAKVNGAKIYQQQVDDAYNRLRQSQPQLFTSTDSSQKIKQQIIENLISQEILSQTASEQGFAIGQDQIASYLSQIPAFQQDGQFSQAKFQLILNRMMFTPEQFMANVEQSMLITQVRNGIAASAFSIPEQAQQFIELINQKRDIGYMLIPASRFISQTNISESQVKQYYQQNLKQFQTPEKVSIEYITITPQAIQASIKPTRAALENYYKDNIANFTTPARWQVAHILLNVPDNASNKQIDALKKQLINIRQQAMKGASFTRLAKQYSEDIVTANQGGVMPWFTAGSLGPVFENTVSALKPGQISEPVQTRYGYEIIKLLKVQQQKVKPFNQVSSQIKSAYITQQAQKLMADKNDALSNLTFENPNSLAQAAKQMNLTIEKTPLFTRKGEKKGLLSNSNIIDTAFSDDVLQQENNSNVITLKDGSLLVLRVNQHIPAKEMPLKAVAAKIKATLQQQQAEKMAMEFGQKLRGQIYTNQQAAKVAIKKGLRWITRDNVGRDEKNINQTILLQAFTMFSSRSEKGLAVLGVALPNGDYALVSVLKVIQPRFNSIPLQQRAVLKQQAEATMVAAAYEAYVKAATNDASVKRYGND